MTFPSNLLSGLRFAVLGLGRNGLPSARALRDIGADVVVWDDAAPTRAMAIQEGFQVAEPDFAAGGFTALVLSPGIPHLLPAPHHLAAAARAAGVAIRSDADLLFDIVRAAGSCARFAGITGTNGKSTTTALLAHLLTAAGVPNAAGGNLGDAALSLPLLPDDGVYVLEMSSYMLERLAALRFDAAAMLNLSPDHIDRHGDMAGYIDAKREIFARQTAEDVAVVGVDDPFSRDLLAWRRTRPGYVVSISGDHPAGCFAAGTVLQDSRGPLADLVDSAALPGAHNAQNAAAACALAIALGLPRAGLAAGLASFPGLPHRQQRVAEMAGVAFVNDSKATNADAAARALGCYDRLIWIAGGQAKQGGIDSLAPYFPRIAEAYLIGRDAALLGATLAAHDVPVRIAGTLEAAVPAAFAAARRLAAPVVLLSPACASFDQFSGFEARGARFAALATGLPPEPAADRHAAPVEAA